ISDLTAGTANTRIDQDWWIGLDEQTPDRLWNWGQLVNRCSFHAGMSSWALRTEDRAIEGAIILRENWIPSQGSGAVLIEYLASAPYNRTELVPQPRFTGCGKRLVLFAVATSYF